MPLSATSFFKRLIVSGMEYALLIRTMPSSPAALAAPDGDNIRAKANNAAEQMIRINMDLLLVATGVERPLTGCKGSRNSEPRGAKATTRATPVALGRYCPM